LEQYDFVPRTLFAWSASPPPSFITAPSRHFVFSPSRGVVPPPRPILLVYWKIFWSHFFPVFEPGKPCLSVFGLVPPLPVIAPLFLFQKAPDGRSLPTSSLPLSIRLVPWSFSLCLFVGVLYSPLGSHLFRLLMVTPLPWRFRSSTCHVIKDPVAPSPIPRFSSPPLPFLRPLDRPGRSVFLIPVAGDETWSLSSFSLAPIFPRQYLFSVRGVPRRSFQRVCPPCMSRPEDYLCFPFGSCYPVVSA